MGANSEPLEKGIVASRCKIQRGQTQEPVGQPQGPGSWTMGNGIVSSRGLSQITKLWPPGGRGRPLKKGIVTSRRQIQRGQTQGPGDQPQGPGAGHILLFNHGISCTKQSGD